MIILCQPTTKKICGVWECVGKCWTAYVWFFFKTLMPVQQGLNLALVLQIYIIHSYEMVFLDVLLANANLVPQLNGIHCVVHSLFCI